MYPKPKNDQRDNVTRAHVVRTLRTKDGEYEEVGNAIVRGEKRNTGVKENAPRAERSVNS